LTEGGPELSVQYAATESGAPSRDFIEACVSCALADLEGELVVRIVDEFESATLHARFRGKQGPTNVLAFPAGETLAPDSEPRLLGDVVICAAIVAREAEEQGKAPEAHWAHIVIHGCLHLVGYDHLAAPKAQQMEARERTLLARLGIGDPYRSEA